MPVPSNVSLRASVNAGAWQVGPVAGGITVAESDVVQLSIANTAGVNKYRWEIVDYPPGFGLPAGWLQDSGKRAYYTTSPTPAPFTIPGGLLLGRWICSVLVNDGKRAGINGLVAAPDLFNDSIGLDLPSASGVKDVPFRETTQFSVELRQQEAHKHNARLLAAGIGEGGGGALPSGSIPAVSTASTGTAGLGAPYAREGHRHQVATGSPVSISTANAAGDSAELAHANHVHAHDDQPGGSLHALATPATEGAGGTAGFVSGVDKEKINAIVLDGPGTNFKADDGTYKFIELSGEINTNSNAGEGVGLLVKEKVGTNTPIKTIAKAEGDLIAVANGVNEVTLSIPNVAIGTGDPSGSLAATKGNVFIRTDVATIYQNTDGSTTWTVVGSDATGTPYNVAPEINTAAAGTAGDTAEYSRGNHRHRVATAAAVSIGTSNTEGDSDELARANHGHNHDDQPGGTLHALATPATGGTGGTAGFVSGVDKEKIDSIIINGDGLSYKANDGTYKVVEGGSGGISNLAIWSPGITDAPPFYGTPGVAVAAVLAQPGPGILLLHPTTASAFTTANSATFDLDERVSVYSINNRTITFGTSSYFIDPAEVGCLQDGKRLTLSDNGSATGTRLIQIESNTLRPHLFNLTKSGTARRLVQFTGGTAASERGIIIGRGVTTAMAGDIYSDGKTAVTLRGHGQSFVAGAVQNSSAHGQNLEVVYEDAQNQALTTLTSSWSTGAASNTFRAAHDRLANLTTGNPHTQYWFTAGSSNFENFYYGSSLSSGQLVIGSTSHATKGPITIWGSVVQVAGARITQVATPTAGTDAVNKDYVDGLGGGGGATDHGALTGLSDDDHSGYWLTAGRSGSQSYYGSSASGGQLTLGSTSHATKGPLILYASYVSANSTQVKNVSAPTVSSDAATKGYVDGLIVTDHGALGGLGDDDHAGYWLTAGRSGNRNYHGSNSSGGQLAIQSTSHATKGPLLLVGSFISVQSVRLTDVATPTVGTDGVNKAYVDGRTLSGTLSGTAHAYSEDGGTIINDGVTTLSATVTGAAVGDAVIATAVSGLNDFISVDYVRISTTNTVTLTVRNRGTDSSPTVNFNIKVIKS